MDRNTLSFKPFNTLIGDGNKRYRRINYKLPQKVLVIALLVNHFKILQQFKKYCLDDNGRIKTAINQIFK